MTFTQLRKFFLALVLTIALAAFPSCGKSPSTNTAARPDPQNAVEYFRAAQAATTTTHGKIKLETAVEIQTTVQYQTDDGKMWRVEMIKQDDGTYHFGTPAEMR